MESGALQASRSLPSMNQAVFWVTPISFANCRLEIPLRAVTSRYIAYSHLFSGILERSKIVPVRMVKSKLQALQ